MLFSAAALLSLCLSSGAMAYEQFAPAKSRDLPPAETAWLFTQDSIKALGCNDFMLHKGIGDIKQYKIQFNSLPFSQRPLLPGGKIKCNLYPDYHNEGVANVVAWEEGTIDGVEYRVNHTGGAVVGFVGGELGWDFSCESRDVGQACYVKGDRFYLQYLAGQLPENVPAGYLISMGKKATDRITRVVIDGKNLASVNEQPYIDGELAADFVGQLKETSVIKVDFRTPDSGSAEVYTLEGNSAPILKASIPLLKKAAEAYSPKP
ncbi:hypothetical protein [Leminorella richardii]|nr:hypothetical protein [Leminorella richardii]